jgi:hypothetical protein
MRSARIRLLLDPQSHFTVDMKDLLWISEVLLIIVGMIKIQDECIEHETRYGFVIGRSHKATPVSIDDME